MKKWFALAAVAIMVVAAAALVIYPRLGQAEATAATPSDTVNAFYEWYLGYIGEGPDRNNPLVARAYADSAFLTTGMVERVDNILDSFAKERAGGYDPFLMAQDVPEYVRVEGEQVSGNSAQVIASTSFPGHELSVTLVQEDGQWKIDDISRAG